MPGESFDPWRTLGVPVGARPEAIRRAFRRLARRRHPDVNRHSPHAHDEFILLRQAYETLMDDEMRSRLERDALSPADELIIVQEYDVALLDAYELLDHGYISEARELYLDLARNRPGDPQLLELLDAIRRAEDRVLTRSPAASAPAAPPRPTRPADAWRDLWQPEPIRVRWWLTGVAAVVVAGCTLLLRGVDAEAVVGPYALPEIGLAVLAGFTGAALVAASGLVGSFDWELGATVGDAGRDAPAWLYLGVAGMVSPALALIFYAIFVLTQMDWSWDVGGFFAAVFAAAALMAWAHGGDLALTILVGSNALFVPGLMGWAFGSIFRPGHWWQ